MRDRRQGARSVFRLGLSRRGEGAELEPTLDSLFEMRVSFGAGDLSCVLRVLAALVSWTDLASGIIP